MLVGDGLWGKIIAEQMPKTRGITGRSGMAISQISKFVCSPCVNWLQLGWGLNLSREYLHCDNYKWIWKWIYLRVNGGSRMGNLGWKNCGRFGIGTRIFYKFDLGFLNLICSLVFALKPLEFAIKVTVTCNRVSSISSLKRQPVVTLAAKQ